VSLSADYTVRLEDVFHGPMDLLLHLVREQEVEIQEVEISRVIDGYLAYLDALSDLDIELAGDFMVMAATLMSIKSRSLLPREEVDLEDELDPKDELIQRLIEYRRFKEVSDGLGARFEQRQQLHPRGSHPELREQGGEVSLELGELTAWDLLGVFSRLMRETLANQPRTVQADARPLRYYVRELAERVRANQTSSLRALVSALDDGVTRESLVGAFCALLELVKLGVVRVRQVRDQDDVEVSLSDEAVLDLEGLLDAARFLDEGEEDPAPLDEDGERITPAAQAGDAAARPARAETPAVAPDPKGPRLDSDGPDGADGPEGPEGPEGPDGDGDRDGLDPTRVGR
jgi:segregation and condensation protein A